MGFPSFFGDIFGLESGSVGYALIKGSAALGFNLGLGALTIDATLAAFGKEQNNCAK